MKFKFKGYNENFYFELNLDDSIKLKDNGFIRFISDDARKKVFKFYKYEMQQSNKITEHNLGYGFIDATGFYDLYKNKRPSWTKFEQFCPSIVYKYNVVNDSVILDPCRMYIQIYTFTKRGEEPGSGVDLKKGPELEFKGAEIVNV